MESATVNLWDKAGSVLEGNWNGKYGMTVPSHKLYPYQWSWDSGFIAMGNSYLNIDRAMAEIDNLFSAQWKNGMLPHVVFYEPSDTYWPEPKYYDIGRSDNSPAHMLTSGMTQPPIHAISCYYIYRNAGKHARKFLDRILPKLQAYHRYLLTDRDPEHSGLATILHPWESGMDDTPIWDDVIAKIVMNNAGSLPEYKRKDVEAVDNRGGERPIGNEYRAFIYLVDLMKECNYDERLMQARSPFRIKDVVFNSVFYVANKCLLELASALGRPESETEEIKCWMALQKSGFQLFKACLSGKTVYYDYDLAAGRQVQKLTSSCIVPLFTGMLGERDAADLASMIRQDNFCGTGRCAANLVPSCALDAKEFDPDRYWRGPFWVNVNWMAYYGLLHHGYRNQARMIRDGIFQLVSEHGFREYYHSITGAGLGGKNFSWTAALVLDLLYHESRETPIGRIMPL